MKNLIVELLPFLAFASSMLLPNGSQLTADGKKISIQDASGNSLRGSIPKSESTGEMKTTQFSSQSQSIDRSINPNFFEEELFKFMMADLICRNFGFGCDFARNNAMNGPWRPDSQPMTGASMNLQANKAPVPQSQKQIENQGKSQEQGTSKPFLSTLTEGVNNQKLLVPALTQALDGLLGSLSQGQSNSLLPGLVKDLRTILNNAHHNQDIGNNQMAVQQSDGDNIAPTPGESDAQISKTPSESPNVSVNGSPFVPKISGTADISNILKDTPSVQQTQVSPATESLLIPEFSNTVSTLTAQAAITPIPSEAPQPANGSINLGSQGAIEPSSKLPTPTGAAPFRLPSELAIPSNPSVSSDLGSQNVPGLTSESSTPWAAEFPNTPIKLPSPTLEPSTSLSLNVLSNPETFKKVQNLITANFPNGITASDVQNILKNVPALLGTNNSEAIKELLFRGEKKENQVAKEVQSTSISALNETSKSKQAEVISEDSNNGRTTELPNKAKDEESNVTNPHLVSQNTIKASEENQPTKMEQIPAFPMDIAQLTPASLSQESQVPSKNAIDITKTTDATLSPEVSQTVAPSANDTINNVNSSQTPTPANDKSVSTIDPTGSSLITESAPSNVAISGTPSQNVISNTKGASQSVEISTQTPAPSDEAISSSVTTIVPNATAQHTSETKAPNFEYFVEPPKAYYGRYGAHKSYDSYGAY